MPPLKKSTSEQEAFLVSLVPLFCVYQQEGKRRDFFPIVESQWFERWPEWKRLFGGDVKLVLTPAQEVEYQVALEAQKKRLKNWYHNYKKDLGRKSMRTKPLSAWLVDMVSKPRGQRAPQLAELYSHNYYTSKVQPLVRKEIERQLKAGETPEAYVSIVKRLTRECFDAESEEVRTEIEEMRNMERTALASALQENDQANSTTLESYQRSVDDLTAVLQQLIDELARRTGWCITVMAGGPEPKEGGAIQVISMHAGVGEDGNNYGAVNPKAFDDTSMKPFISFLKRVFPKEVRITRAFGYVPPPPNVDAPPVTTTQPVEGLVGPDELAALNHRLSPSLDCFPPVETMVASGTSSMALPVVPDSVHTSLEIALEPTSNPSLSVMDTLPVASAHVQHGPFNLPQVTSVLGFEAQLGSHISPVAAHMAGWAESALPIVAPDSSSNVIPSITTLLSGTIPPATSDVPSGTIPGTPELSAPSSDFTWEFDMSTFLSTPPVDMIDFSFSDPISAGTPVPGTSTLLGFGPMGDLDSLLSGASAMLEKFSDAQLQVMSGSLDIPNNPTHRVPDYGPGSNTMPDITMPIFHPAATVNDEGTSAIATDTIDTAPTQAPDQLRPRRMIRRPLRPDEEISMAELARDRKRRRVNQTNKENE